ncbi:hypothetical protein BT69DRAFT_62131 [Atractiella rhizophila]|nr:hypothetical protein BT69DRAFT_62131 [Atractiella rhizophila]
MYIGANDTPASSTSSRSATLKRLADPALAAAKGRMVVGSKRPRTNRACEQCRKQKSRCEPSTSNTRACHRCHKLTIPCSFLSLPEQLDSTIPSQESSPASPIIHFTHSSQSRDALTNILLQEHIFKRISGEITDEQMDKLDFNRDWADIPGVLNSVLLSFESREECFESSQQRAPEITDDRRAQWDEIYQRYYVREAPSCVPALSRHHTRRNRLAYLDSQPRCIPCHQYKLQNSRGSRITRHHQGVYNSLGVDAS